jgi:cysteine-rich repeat protein
MVAMKWPLLVLAIATAAACDTAYVVLTIDDPDGAADGATAVQLSPEGGEPTELPLARGLPDTVTLRGVDGEDRGVNVAAVDGEAVLARGFVTVSFRPGEVGAATVALRAACDEDADCDDGVFCNGAESCEAGACADGAPPCASSGGCSDLSCDEDADGCAVEVFHDRCDPVVDAEGQLLSTYCSVTEGCVVGEPCDADTDCDDGDPCNGDERCLEGTCVFGESLERDDDNDCTRDFCTVEEGVVNLAVPDGNTCSTTGASEDGICVSGACGASVCGDGFLDLGAGEICDDGPDNDDVSGACRTDCTACGDGVVQAAHGEACDDSGESATCNADCRAASCGDGVVNTSAGEQCDDGDQDDTDDCPTTCVPATCGDGFTLAGVEPCDDGNASFNDDCLPGCIAATCGDGILNNLREDCDDGNLEIRDGCGASCDFVAWQANLGAPIAGAPVSWRFEEVILVDPVDAGPDPDAGPDAGPPEPIPEIVARTVVAAVTTTGELHAFERTTGAPFYSYDADAGVLPGLAAGNRVAAFVTDEDPAVVHMVPIDGDEAQRPPATVTLDTAGGAVAFGRGAALINVPASTQERHQDSVLAVDGAGKLYDLRGDGTSGQFLGRSFSTAPYPHSVDAATPCEDCRPTTTNDRTGANGFDPGALIVPLGEELWVWNFRTPCPPEQLSLLPGEKVIQQMVYLGNGSLSLDDQDSGFFATTFNNIVKIKGDPSFTCGSQVTELWRHVSGTTLTNPPIATFHVDEGLRAIYYGGADGKLERVRFNNGTRFGPPWPYDAGAAIVTTPSLSNANTIYIVDANDVVHAVDKDTATARWTFQLDAPATGSPLVASRLVFVTTEAGTLYALERGDGAQGGGWSREGGSALGSNSTTNCRQARVSLWWPALLGALFLIRKRKK